MDERIERFLDGDAFAVVGASRDRSKYGNKVLRAYLQRGRKVFAINPSATQIEGQPAFARLGDLPGPVHGISIVTPPEITETIVEDAGRLGIKHVWMQPGAESAQAVRRCNELGINVIGGDACALVVLGFREAGAG